MQIQALRSDNSLNRVIRQARKDKAFTYILFTSPWDKSSQAVLDYVESLDTNDSVIYTVDYFTVPQSWMQFKAQPGTLLKINEKKIVPYPGSLAVKLELH
jgi:hypothetical protein